MENIPSYVGLTFIAVVLATLGFIFYALNLAAPGKRNFTPTIVVTFILVWLFLLSIATFYDFFQDFSARPPRLILIGGPPLLTIIYLFINKNTRSFLLKMPLTTLTYIHIVRVPVEIVLWWLTKEQVFPDTLTFEGVNYDILSGISAPFAGVFLVGMRSKSRIGAIIWNALAFVLVINIVARAISATPYFFNPEVYNVPNLAVFYFPFVLLPGFVVPAVIFSHGVSFLKLFSLPEEEKF